MVRKLHCIHQSTISLSIATPLTLAMFALFTTACDSENRDQSGASSTAGLSGGGIDSGQGDANEGGSEEGSGGQSSGASDSTSPADTQGSGAGDSADGDQSSDSGSNGETSGDSDEGKSDDSDGDSDDGLRFDVSTPDVGGPPEGEGLKHSYIWIANSSESTVSKVDTRTLEEKGRYITRPDKAGNPSRTSVGLAGDVAVANRFGGITKIYADTTKCEDKDGSGEIDTAVDKEFLAWDAEECVAWHVPMAYGSQRGLAWAQGDLDPETGLITGESLWVTGVSSGETGITVIRLKGDDGSEEGRVLVDLTLDEGEVGPTIRSPFPYGAYGGAVDPDRNFWFTNLGGGAIVRVSYSDMSFKAWDKPHGSYGMTVDRKGRVWTCGAALARFSLATEEWELVNGNFGSDELQASSGGGGCMVDAEDRLWKSGTMVAGGNGLFAIDIETMSAVKAIPLPSHSHGVSIDFDGYVWGVARGKDAFRVDPKAETFETFSDLVGAYTYSDMTGFALSAVSPKPVD